MTSKEIDKMTAPKIDTNFSLANKVALITGGAAGIGRAIAEVFGQKGAKLVLVDKSEAVGAVADEFTAKGVEALGIATDITVRSNIEQFVEEASKRFGTIDILVNNAGVVLLAPAEDLTDEAWDVTMAVNLKAPYMISQIVGRKMIAQRSGKIISMASQAGLVALDQHLAYCASKAAIISLTKVLAYEWGRYNINVNSISPTVVLTELGKKAWAGEVGEAFKAKIPLGRFAYPEEIAAAALFLASSAADMISGENLVIDGGYTIQ
jgi:NAD(P)-dependent dehydrogenase (short-subunit alcohol dehydrogenase family)